MTYRGMPSSERKKKVHEALERVGMSHRIKHYPSQLSGGQQQRVAVARALAGDPSILLADEPTGNLDSQNGEQVMDLLRELHRGGATICMVTHDPRYARTPTARFICLTVEWWKKIWRFLSDGEENSSTGSKAKMCARRFVGCRHSPRWRDVSDPRATISPFLNSQSMRLAEFTRRQVGHFSIQPYFPTALSVRAAKLPARSDPDLRWKRAN